MELSITEAATLLGRSARTVRAQVARGELPGFKRGGQWVIRKEALPLSEAQRRAALGEGERQGHGLAERQGGFSAGGGEGRGAGARPG